MNGKQRTLFQAWGSGVAPEPRRAPEPPAKKAKAKAARKGKSVSSQRDPHRAAPPVWQEAAQQVNGEDDDDVLLVAVYEAEKTLNATVTDNVPPDPPCATDIQNLPGFDLSAGNVWIYPTNFPVREYQFTMAHASLLNNTLVCLPTGLGKTFIAAVVMYNFYRWYPSGKIVFMAPTKPLVAQQIEACFQVMGIPQEHMVEMTGNTQAQNRRDMWQCHRVFFLTPQIMVNDLTRGACPASEIKCLVIDEAHKALGNHAYCQVVRELSNYTKQFRILALSATPGSDTKAVQQVVSNLLIGRIELRSEDSPDILPYSHERQLEKFVVALGDELEVVQKAYLQVLDTFAGRLIQNNLLLRRDIPNLTKYQIILFRDQFRKNPPSDIVGAQMGVVEGDFALCISLYHGYELLLQMGSRSLYYYLRSIMDGSKGMTRARNDLSRNADFMKLYQQLESLFSAPSGSDVGKPYMYSHPKLKKLEEVVIEHFKSWNKKGQNSSETPPEDTRIMIFSSFRDSVQEIADMLNRHHPTVRVMTFVGHSSTGKGVKGFTQKEQLEVVKRFREGGYNTLVSTCVGEEGLDIGEVDLIICFDAQKSPIRLVQRMGRTGRKRQGRIAVILSKGREERTYNQSQSNKRSIYKAILGNNSIFHLNHESPRMVPEGLNPTVHKMYITQRTYDAKDAARPNSKDRRSSLKHRKSSAFFNNEGANKKDWLLTPEQYETWKRLYRLTESDGITDVVLPRTQFELFKDPESNMEQVSGNVHELSLSEWTVWQNRPFPTHFVDHSVRTKNFIAVMEVIERMRGEEGECSYDKEMNAFLDKAETQPKQASRDCSTVTSKLSKKLPALKSKIQKNPLPMTENDEDFVPLFKPLRKAKSSSSEHENTDLLDCTTAMEISSDAEEAHVSDKDQDSVDKMEIGHCGDVVPGSSELPKKSPTAVQAPKSPTKVDSGYHSFSEDNSDVLPNMFYTQHMYNNHYLTSEIVEKTSHILSNMLSRVKNFLTCSPPPLNELDSLEDIDICLNDLTTRGSMDISVEACCSVQKSYTKNSDSLVHAACPSVKKNYVPQEELSEIATPPSSSSKDYHVQAVEEFEPSALSSQEDYHVEAVEENGPSSLSSQEEFHMESVQKKVASALSSPEDHHVETVEENGPSALSPKDHHVETVESALEAGEDQNDRQWDDIFDSDGDETYIENFDSPTKHGYHYRDEVENEKTHTEKRDFPKICSPSKKVKIGEMDSVHEISIHSSKFNKEKTDSDETDIEATRTCSPHQSNHNIARQHEGKTELDFPDYLEDSFDLFEDEKCAEVDELSSSKTMATKKHSHERTTVNFNMFDASLLMDDHTEPETTAGLSSCKDLEQTEIEDELGSCELFSVNFDLGFSFDDVDDDDVGVDDGDHSEEKPEVVQPQSVVDAGLFKAPSPPKRTVLGGGNISTPVTSGIRSSTFGISEKQISPVGDKVSQMLEKSLSSSMVTPVIEKVNNFKAPYSPVDKHDKYTHSTPHTAPRNLNTSLVVVRPNTVPDPIKNDDTVTIGSSPESEEDVVFRRKRKLAAAAAAVLKSPESTSSECDFDSPMPGAKKRGRAHNTKLSSDDDLDSPMPGAKKSRLALNTVFSDDEDLELPTIGRKSIVQDRGRQRDARRPKHKRKRHAARQFIDEEAELSEEEAEYVSSDESVESDNEQDTSLVEFLNDNTQLSQALNDSEMHGIYMKSIRSPAVGNKYKMTHKRHSMSVFSQIPEQDEDYMEDSFCVEEDEEEEEENEDSSTEEIQMDLNLLHQDSFVDGRKQYRTRRRLKLKGTESKQVNQVPPAKKKRRIIIHEDSSDEETEASDHQKSKANTSSLKSVNASSSAKLDLSSSSIAGALNEKKELFALPLKDRCQMRINAQASLSEELDFQTDAQSSFNTSSRRASNSYILSTDKLEDTSVKSVGDCTWMGSSMNASTIGKVLGSAVSSDRLCILADSREISSGPEVISCLKSTHGVQVEICSLGGCDYIVSNRLSVERKSQSEFSNCSNRSKMAERIQHLRSMFDRVCLILEKDRVKPGETSRIFQRTKYYDSTLSSLISAGVQILFSSTQEETAGLLKELASLERRKNMAISTPTQVTSHKQEAMNFYLSIPNVSYITALNLCHRFSSVRQMANSSVDDLSSKGQVSRQKAEEIYRYLHYQFDPRMLQTGDKRKHF